MKYKAVTHLQDIHGGIVTPDSIVDDKDLGDKEVIDRYLEIDAITEASKDELKAAEATGSAVPAGGSIVTSKPIDGGDKDGKKNAVTTEKVDASEK